MESRWAFLWDSPTHLAHRHKLVLAGRIILMLCQGGGLLAQLMGIGDRPFRDHPYGVIEIPLSGIGLRVTQSRFLLLSLLDYRSQSLLDHHLIVRDGMGDDVGLGGQEEEQPFRHPLAERIVVVFSADLLDRPVHPVGKYL